MNLDQSSVFHATHWKACSQWTSKIPSEPAQVRIIPVAMYAQKFLHVPPRYNAFYAIAMENSMFTHAYRDVNAGLLVMKTGWHGCSGTVSSLRKSFQVST